jgi:hypothetical protein
MIEISNILLFLLFYSICFPFQEKPTGIPMPLRHQGTFVWEEKFITRSDIDGVFVNTSSPGLDTLVFGSDGWTPIGNFNGEGYFFLMTRDSMNKQVIIHGAWDFEACDPHHPSDCGRIDFHTDGFGGWHCRVHTRISLPEDTSAYPNMVVRTVTIDTIFKPLIKSFYDPEKVLFNSVGKPYTFQREHMAVAQAKK